MMNYKQFIKKYNNGNLDMDSSFFVNKKSIKNIHKNICLNIAKKHSVNFSVTKDVINNFKRHLEFLCVDNGKIFDNYDEFNNYYYQEYNKESILSIFSKIDNPDYYLYVILKDDYIYAVNMLNGNIYTHLNDVFTERLDGKKNCQSYVLAIDYFQKLYFDIGKDLILKSKLKYCKTKSLLKYIKNNYNNINEVYAMYIILSKRDKKYLFYENFNRFLVNIFHKNTHLFMFKSNNIKYLHDNYLINYIKYSIKNNNYEYALKALELHDKNDVNKLERKCIEKKLKNDQ